MSEHYSLVSLPFVAVINPYSIFFKYSSLFTFYITYNSQAKIIKGYRRLINYALINNSAYMEKQPCYRKLQSKNIRNLFFKRVIMLFRSWRCKEAHKRNIVPVIDEGVFHNYRYVHVCKQLFSCDVIGGRYSQSTPLSWVSHLL